MAVDGVERRASTKASAEVLCGGGVDTGGAGGTEGAVAGVDVVGLVSEAGIVGVLDLVTNWVLVLRGEPSSSLSDEI